MSLWPTTPAYSSALAAGRREWSAQVDVLQRGQVVHSMTSVIDGSVRVDSTAVRRTLDLTLIDPTGALTPTSARDLLSPRQAEVRVWRGLKLLDGSVEKVPLGTFRVIEPEVDSADGALVVKLSGRDRSDAVTKRRFVDPWTVKSGTPTHEAITAIVKSRLDVPVRVTPTGSTTPETVFEALSDPWKAVLDLAEADSMVAYFDALGTLVVAPDEEIPSGITYRPGRGSLLLDAKRAMNAEAVYSGVVVTGQHPDNDPIRYVLWDNDPKSPTYYLGDFGMQPYGYNSTLINTEAKAQAAAATILRRVTKMRQKVTLTTVGHPGHDVGDVIHVEHPGSRTNGDFVLTSASIPLRPGPITLNGLERIP